MEEFTSSWKALSAPHLGSVIEFTFDGIHHWTHGPKMVRLIETVLAQETAAAAVINLDAYRYEFGNDLFPLFMLGFDKATKRLRPVCVLAQGQTEAALKSLLAGSHAGIACDVTFASTPAQVTEWLDRKG